LIIWYLDFEPIKTVKTTVKIVKSKKKMSKNIVGSINFSFCQSVRFRISLLEGRCRDIIWGFIHSYFVINFIGTFYRTLKNWLASISCDTSTTYKENDKKKFKSTKIMSFQIFFFLFLSKSNDNFGCRLHNSKTRESTKNRQYRRPIAY
jgi:hypothetical protein